jgi:hypothetical protein
MWATCLRSASSGYVAEFHDRCETVGQALRLFPATTRTFTKDTAMSENDRIAAWHMLINAVGERHGRGMGTALYF